jgi:hypothetical protein
MAYLRAQVTRVMLPYTIAIPATISAGAIMNVVSLISTEKEFTESTCNSMTPRTQCQQQLQGLIGGKGGTSSK